MSIGINQKILDYINSRIVGSGKTYTSMELHNELFEAGLCGGNSLQRRFREYLAQFYNKAEQRYVFSSSETQVKIIEKVVVEQTPVVEEDHIQISSDSSVEDLLAQMEQIANKA